MDRFILMSEPSETDPATASSINIDMDSDDDVVQNSSSDSEPDSDDEIDYIDIEEEKMTIAEFLTTRLSAAKKKKIEANAMFVSKQNEEARDLYLQAMQHLNRLKMKHLQDDKLAVDQLRATLNSNLAAVYNRMSEWEASIKCSTVVLEKDPTSTKALFRRAYAHFHRSSSGAFLKNARTDLLVCCKHDGTNKPARKLLKKVKAKMTLKKEESRKAMEGMFDGGFSADIEKAKEKKRREEKRKKAEEKKKAQEAWKEENAKREVAEELPLKFEAYRKMMKEKRSEEKKKDEERMQLAKEERRRRQRERDAAPVIVNDDDAGFLKVRIFYTFLCCSSPSRCSICLDAMLSLCSLCSLSLSLFFFSLFFSSLSDVCFFLLFLLLHSLCFVVQGYKKTKDGRTTSYFTTELDDKVKALIGNMTPKKINAGENKVSATNWEESGTTFVARDCSKLGETKLISMLEGMLLSSSPIEEGEMIHQVTIVRVKDVEGSASVLRNTKGKTFLWEFSFECEWEFQLNNEMATGWLKIVDITDHSEDDLQTEWGWTSREEFCEEYSASVAKSLAQLRTAVLREMKTTYKVVLSAEFT